MKVALVEQTMIYPAPGSPESPISLKPRYGNFIARFSAGDRRLTPSRRSHA
jgi:hypothetical protein